MPRNKYPEQTVEKILNAAAALFAEKGYAHTTLQDIIDATGLSKGAVYHHFQSKEEIAARVGDRLGTQVTGELARIRDDAALTGLQKLQAVFAVCLFHSASRLCSARCRVSGTTRSFYPSSCTTCWKRPSPCIWNRWSGRGQWTAASTRRTLAPCARRCSCWRTSG